MEASTTNRNSGRNVALLFAAALSAVLSYAYASLLFAPSIWLRASSLTSGYDAYRYSDAAMLISRWPTADILLDPIWQFEFSGYVRVLALVYALLTPDPVVGCLVNWVMWAAAGLLLLPIVADEPSAPRSVGGWFLGLWLLLPEAIDWTGTTSKEPLCVLLIAAAIRLGMAFAGATVLRTWLCGAVVALLAVAGTSVRGALLPLIVLPWLMVVETRFRASTSRMPWAFTACALVVFANFLGLGGDLFGSLTGHDSGSMGYDFGKGPWASTSDRSVLLQIGSSNRWLDALAIPVRGLAHIVAPLNASPAGMAVAQVSAPSLLQWTSALLYCSMALAVGLQWRAVVASKTGKLLACVSALAILVLGTTGIIHERYRSILVPAYLPLGVRSLRLELDGFSVRRIGPSAMMICGLATVAYAWMKLA